MFRVALWAAIAAIALWAHRRHRVPRDAEVPRALAFAAAACIATIAVENAMRLGLASVPAVAAILQVPVSLALWGAVVWLVAYGTRRRDLIVRVPLLAAVCISGASGADATTLFILSAMAMWVARWPRSLTTPVQFRVAVAALALLLLSCFAFVGAEPQTAGTVRTLGQWTLGMARVAAWVALVATFFAYARDPGLGIRSVSRRLAVSHVLVAVIPLLLLGSLWAVTTLLGTNRDRATIAARQAQVQCEDLARALGIAIFRPESARPALVALAGAYERRWPGLGVWIVRQGSVERVSGDSLAEETELAGWTNALGELPASGAVALPSGARLGAAARSAADPSLAVVALAPADSVLARDPARVSGARLHMTLRAVSTRRNSTVVSEAPEPRRDGPGTSPSVEDSITEERIRQVTRRLGLPDSVVRTESRPRGGLVVTAGGDTMNVRESGGSGLFYQGYAVLDGVVLDDGAWSGRRILMSALVPPADVLLGLYRGMAENPLGMLPTVAILSIAVMFALVVWFDLRIVASVGGGINAVMAALRTAAAKLQTGQLSHRIELRGEDDLWNVASALNHAAEGLEEAREREKERERMESELAVARGIQARLLPGAPPRIAGLEIAGLSESAREVGGDYYDHIALGGSRVLLVIADVSGKGVPASLLMSAFRASLMSQDLAVAEPSRLAATLNDFLVRSVEPGRFVTAFLGILDGTTGRLAYTNAGHNPPLVLRRDGSHETLERGGLIFGVLAGGTYASGETTLGPGDLVVLFTDGVTEGANAAHELWGDDRLLEAARRLDDRPCDVVATRIAGEVRAFEGEQGPADDITLLVARRDPAGGGENGP